MADYDASWEDDDWTGKPDSDDFGLDSDEDERAAMRGTSQCDGLCDPMCDWCLAAHRCPDDCQGGVCPYEALEKGET